MPSYLKAILHTVLTTLALWVGVNTGNVAWLQWTVGGAVAFVLNFVASHYFATTTGASARQ